MPSAFRSRNSIVVRFNGVQINGAKNLRQFRVPPTHPDPLALARECEELCRQLENPLLVNERLIAHAREKNAISEHEAAALLGLHEPTPRTKNPKHLTILEAAAQHPATIREEANPKEYDRHLANLKEFLKWSEIQHVKDITLPLVTRYVAHLEATGRQPSTINHALLWIRRASRMGAQFGITDKLTGFIITRKSTIRKRIDVYTLNDIVLSITQLTNAGKHRPAAAIALGGLMGLRPSEIVRAKIGDVSDGLLQTGFKNQYSIRRVAIPRFVYTTITPLLNREPSAPLITRDRKHMHHREDRFGSWLQKNTAPITGVAIAAHTLRKSFCTWADACGLTSREYEPYMGHARSDVLAITRDHYMSRQSIADTRIVAAKIDAAIAAAATAICYG